MATIKKTLSKKSDAQGYSQILFRVSVNKNKRVYVKTGIFIPEKRWNEEKECINVSGRGINGFEKKELIEAETGLKSIEAKTLKLCILADQSILDSNWLELALIACKDISAEEINIETVESAIDKYNNPEKYTKLSFFDLFAAYLSDTKYSKVREKNFQVLIRALKRYEFFIRETDNKSFRLDIDNITKETIVDFESFLRNEHTLLEESPKIFDRIPATTDQRRSPKPQPRGNNTICALFNKLRAFFNWCNKQGKTNNRPFDGYNGVTTEKYGTPYYITLEERNRIADFDFSELPQLAIQRDIFIFQCCIGCRVSDLIQLKKSSLVDGEINYIPRKTKDKDPITVKVPLNERAAEIVKRYECIDSDKLLPFISTQKYNEAIKRIFTLVGITRLVTILDPQTGNEIKRPINEIASSHMARRTFVGNLYSKVKDPNLICPLSGHKVGSTAFARYREIDKKLRTETVKLID